MMQRDEERVTITLNVAPTFEERIVDWLLECDVAPGFTSYSAYGHGARQEELSLAEQVSGRQRRIEFRIELPRGSLESFIAALAPSFAGTDLYFFVSPVLRSGHLRDTLPASPGTA